MVFIHTNVSLLLPCSRAECVAVWAPRSGEPASALGASARSSATSCLAERVKLTFTQKLSERQFVNIWLL